MSTHAPVASTLPHVASTLPHVASAPSHTHTRNPNRHLLFTLYAKRHESSITDATPRALAGKPVLAGQPGDKGKFGASGGTVLSRKHRRDAEQKTLGATVAGLQAELGRMGAAQEAMRSEQQTMVSLLEKLVARTPPAAAPRVMGTGNKGRAVAQRRQQQMLKAVSSTDDLLNRAEQVLAEPFR